MNYYNIDNDRYQYIKDIFDKNKNIVLSWERNTGKTKYVSTYLLDKLINTKNIKILSITNNISHRDDIINKMYILLKKYYNIDAKDFKKLLDINESELKFITERNFKNLSGYYYDFILIDDIEFFNNLISIINVIHTFNPSKIILTGDHKLSSGLIEHVNKLFNNNLYISTHKNDRFLQNYIRKVKINRLESKIKV